MEGVVVRVGVRAPAVVVYLLEVGLGNLADLRPTGQSLANLAVDRQALLLDKEAPNQVLTSPPLSGMGRGGGHGHKQPSSEKLSISSGNLKGWWSWSYTSFV